MHSASNLRLDEADAVLLKAYLSEERECQESLHDALEKIESEVVAGRSDGLQEQLVSLKPFLNRMESTATRRRKVLGHLGAKLGMQTSGIDMERMEAATPDSHREQIKQARAHLRDLVTRTRRLNGRVNMIIRHMMSFNRDLLRGIFDLDSAPTIYQPDGGTSENSDRNILDRSY